MMEIMDYNGTGIWSADEIVRRYQSYAQQFGIDPPRDIQPEITERVGRRRVYPVMGQIIDGIRAGDVACAQIGVEFIGEDQGFAFGLILKEGAARALRQFDGLTPDQVATIRKRIVGMLATGVVPREFESYKRLLRKVGVGEYASAIKAAEPKNNYAARGKRYLERHVLMVEQG